MLVASRRSRIAGAAFLFSAGVATGLLATPLRKNVVILVSEERYQEATYRCDRAMREHLIAKQQVVHSPGKETVAGLRAAEVGLLDCQDYDLLRKRLIQWGLDENDLSLMGLKAIEAKAEDLGQVIEIHEIRY